MYDRVYFPLKIRFITILKHNKQRKYLREKFREERGTVRGKQISLCVLILFELTNESDYTNVI